MLSILALNDSFLASLWPTMMTRALPARSLRARRTFLTLSGVPFLQPGVVAQRQGFASIFTFQLAAPITEFTKLVSFGLSADMTESPTRITLPLARADGVVVMSRTTSAMV